MQDQYGEHISDKDVLSSAMYPQVFQDWQDFRYKYGTKVAALPTRAFLTPLKEDEEIMVELAPGSDVTIKYKARGELQPNGKREVFFETYGVPRVMQARFHSKTMHLLPCYKRYTSLQGVARCVRLERNVVCTHC